MEIENFIVLYVMMTSQNYGWFIWYVKQWSSVKAVCFLQFITLFNISLAVVCFVLYFFGLYFWYISGIVLEKKASSFLLFSICWWLLCYLIVIPSIFVFMHTVRVLHIYLIFWPTFKFINISWLYVFKTCFSSLFSGASQKYSFDVSYCYSHKQAAC